MRAAPTLEITSSSTSSQSAISTSKHCSKKCNSSLYSERFEQQQCRSRNKQWGSIYSTVNIFNSQPEIYYCQKLAIYSSKFDLLAKITPSICWKSLIG